MRQIGMLLLGLAILCYFSSNATGEPITDPSQLSPNPTLIDFEQFTEGYSRGIYEANPLVIGDVAFSIEGYLYIRYIGGGTEMASSNVLEPEPDTVPLTITFLNAISEIILGWWDPNFPGNFLRAYNKDNSLLEEVEITDVDVPGGIHSTWIGFKRPSPDISKIEVVPPTIVPPNQPWDNYGIDNIYYHTAATALPFCVSTPQQFIDALNTAAGNGQDDVIQIVQGNYSGNFVYNSSETMNLTIEGGYTSGCSSRTVDPGNTVLDGGANGTVVNLQTPNTLNLKLDALTVQNGTASGLRIFAPGASFVLSNSRVQYNSCSGNGGGISIVAKNIDLSNNSILFNTAAYGGGVNVEDSNAQTINIYDNFIGQNITNSGEGGGIHIKWGSPTVNLVNNVISRNATTKYIGGGHGGGAHISTYGKVNFINNTVVGNTANLVCCWGGGITIYYSENANVYNNVFRDNTSNPGRDIAFSSVSSGAVSILNNNIDHSADGVSGLSGFVFDSSNQDSNNSDPLFVDSSSEDYHLLFDSPCVDSGTNAAPELPATDKDGLPRIIGGIVDIGAYEHPLPRRVLSNIKPAIVWIGLKNSDDQGTRFDIRAAVYVNDVLVAEGKKLCVTGITRNPSNAKEVMVPFGPVLTNELASGDVVSLKVFTRIGTNPDGSKCPGHSNALGLRLYYNSPTRPSGFGAEISPTPMADYFLHSGGGDYFLDDVSPTGPVKYKDSSGVNYKNGNPWKEIGTWSMTLP